MKLLIFTPIDLAFGAGFEEWISKVCLILKKELEISIAYGDVGRPKRWDDNHLNSKFRTKNLIKLHYRSIFSKIFFLDFSSLFKLYREFKKNDIIYFNCTFIGIDILVLILSVLTSKKVIFGFHAPFFFENIIHNLYFKTVIPLILRFIYGIHVLNAHDEIMLKKFNPRIYRIPAFLLSSGYPKTNIANFKGEFLFAGRFDFQKGLDLLVPALEILIKKNRNLNFVFYGSGPERNILNQLIKKYPQNIKLEGFETDKAKIFSNRKYLLLFSRYESFPAVAIEAMSYGLPVISSNIPGSLDIVSDNQNGFISPSLTIDKIYRTIKRAALLDKQNYARMSRSAFLEARKYSDKKVKNKFLKMFCS